MRHADGNDQGIVNPGSNETITVYLNPFTSDTDKERTLLYSGPEIAQVQQDIDEKLKSGEFATAELERSNGTGGTQILPSYCEQGWPRCPTCMCNASNGPVGE